MTSRSTAEIAEMSSANYDQLTEVASIKAAFPNRCRVVSGDREFTKVVTVQPENMDVTIKFQLSAAYPSVIPEISLRSESLTEESIADMRQLLKSRASEMLGQQMIKLLITEANAYLKVLGLKPGHISYANRHTHLYKQNQKMRKHKAKPKAEDEMHDKKLPSMKTADDVVKRIIWDDALEKDDFIVGYSDRFRGLIEKCFSDFSWEDLAIVDYDVLAVPKHRIQYFKYKNIKVWDKTKRIDNIFGSAEGTKTIDVIVKELQELERLGLTAADSTLYKGGENCNSQNNSDEDSTICDDDSDNCEIEVIIGSPAAVPADKSVKESDHLECKASSSGKYRKDLQISKETYNLNKQRPNHFLCIRITSQEIQDKIGKLQDALIDREPIYSECCIPGAALHLTLFTLGLDTPDHVLQCIHALTNMKPVLESALPISSLKVHGVFHFSNQVIYAKIEHTKDFSKFCNLLKHLIEEAGVQIRDEFDFVPHVTIMKITRPVARSLGTRYISPELYSNHIDTYFGEQNLNNINLCSIGKERRDDGFYLTPLELHFKI